MILKNYLAFLMALITFPAIAQIDFEPGYIIDLQGNKIECLIENREWLNNPVEFSYKQPGDHLIYKGNFTNVLEFGINNTLKYIQTTVAVDRSSVDLDNLSHSRNPEFVTETIFLKVLIEGDAALFSYTDQNLKRFFFSLHDEPINQLVYKNYFVSKTQMGENRLYQQQLVTTLKCQGYTPDRVKSIRYSEKDLLRYFINHNKCVSNEYQLYQKPEEKRTFWSLEAGVSVSSVKVHYAPSSTRNMHFKSGLGYTIGIEIEHMMAFNKNKWSFIFEPNFHSLKNTAESANYKSNLNYNAISLPLGIRYSIYLNELTRFFLTSTIGVDFAIGSSVIFEDGPLLELKGTTFGSIGAGVKINRLLIESRYYLPHQLAGQYVAIEIPKSNVNLSIGYSIF